MKKQLTGKEYLQKIQNIAYLALAPPLLIFIYLYLESSVDQLHEIIPAAYHVTVFISFFIICVALIFWSFNKFNFFIKKAIPLKDLKKKLNLYQIASNTRFIIYGTSALLTTLGFYLTNFQPFAGLFGLLIVLFSINNPNARKIVVDLKLKKKEKEIILKGLDIP